MHVNSATPSQPEANAARPRLPWLPWFPADFLSSTRGWPVTARGVYRELLDCQWDLGSLPSDAKELRHLINATPTEWRTAWSSYVESKFPVGADGQRRNARLHQLREKALAKSIKLQQIGSIGGKASARGRATVTPIRGAVDG